MMNPDDLTHGDGKLFVQLIIDAVYEAFRDENNRREFEDWHLKTYGKPFVWDYPEYGKENGENEKH